MEYYNYIKALHIIFVVTWFAGLFYIVRLFIYKREAQDKTETEKHILSQQFEIMQKRLFYGITWPSMVLTYIFGFSIIWIIPQYLYSSWFILKLSFVFALTVYHFYCQIILNQQNNNIYKHGSFFLRIFNEVATVFLVSIVFIIVLKDLFSWVWGIVGILVFTLVLLAAIKIYKNTRIKNNNP